MTEEAIVERWRRNAAAAGIPLSEEDIARIRAAGSIARLRRVEELIMRLDAREVVPDYLDTLSAQPEERRHA